MLIPLGILSQFRGIADKVLAVATGNSPYAQAYEFINGFGTKYANPATLPSGSPEGLDFSPAEDSLAGGFTFGSTQFGVYRWSSSGFGTVYTAPTNTTGTSLPTDIKFSPNGNALVLSFNIGSLLAGWAWSSSGWGTRFSAPATAPTNSVGRVSFSPNSDYVALGSVTSLSSPTQGIVYSFSGSGFGTQILTPLWSPNGSVSQATFTTNGNAVIYGSPSNPRIYAFPFSSGSFGSIFSAPATSIGQTPSYISSSPDSNTVMVGTGNTPFIHAYAFSGSGWGTKYADPTTLPAGQTNSVKFSKSGKRVALGSGASPYLNVYFWDNGFGTRYANPAVLPGSGSVGVEALAWA